MESKKIYELVRNKIIWLDLTPGSIINLNELTNLFKVSRTPIKEALIYLEADGWVLRQGSHFIVTPLSMERMKEITEIRSLIEIQANVWAMNRITPEELIALETIEKEILQMSPTTDNKQMIELDVKFHQNIFRASKNAQLMQLLDTILAHYLRFWLAIPRKIEPKSFFAEIQEIIEAIKAKDEFKLRAASIQHIRKSLNEIVGAFYQS